MQWFLNSPYELYWDHALNFFAHLFSLDPWLSLIAANLSFLILILIPGFALSYLLRDKKMDLSLRTSFALALGFFVPLVLFYLLGLTHLYYKIAWLISGLILSGLSIWKFRKNFAAEWKDSHVSRFEKIFYSLVGLYIFYTYIAVFPNGIIDFDILFGQVGPASFLFFEHYYNPFDMGALPITRHELFPGPIAYHSVFMLGAAPWVGITAVLVFLGPLFYRMLGQISEFFIARGSQYFAVIFALVTFFGFRFRSGRGTVMAMIFLFAFFLLTRVYENLLEKGEAKFKEVLRPAIANSIFVAMALYVNIEIAAILLGIMVLVFVFSWLTNYRALMKTIALSIAGGFLLYLPWFGTVLAILFKEKMLLFLAAYFVMILLALAFYKLPKVEVKEQLLSRILLVLIAALFVWSGIIGRLFDLFRLPQYLMWISAAALLGFGIYSFKKINFKTSMFLLAVWIFALTLTVLYPHLRPLFASLGAAESLMFVLFDKDVGSVFPELVTKVYEYFLPLFTVLMAAALLTFAQSKWQWNKKYFYVLLVIFFYFVCFRIQASDMDDRTRGQTLGANFYLAMASQYAFGEAPGWYPEPAQEVMAELRKIKKPGDRVFSFMTAYNPYFPETQYHYIVEGVGTAPLGEEDLVADKYTIEVLNQVIEAGADYLLISNAVDPTLWLNDPRVEVIVTSADQTLALARVK